MRPAFTDTVEDRLCYARAAAVFKAPYFASVIHGFVYVPMEGIRTMLCTPKMVLGYDPEWVKEATIGELAADIAHEVNHFMRKHFLRAGGVEDPKLFNIAGDLAINPDLRNAGWEIADKKSKRPAIFPKDFELEEGLSTEEYYAKLLQMKAEGKLKSPSGDPSGGGQGEGDPQSGEGKPSEKDGQGQGQGQGQKPGPGICAGHCGGIAGGTDDPRMGEALDTKEGRSEVEVQSIAKRTAAAIKAHIEAKGRGSLPANLAEFAKGLIEEPHVRWQSELAHVIRHASGRIQAGGEDFSMSRPSKRSIMRGITRPGMIEHQPEVAIVRDSSGSMNINQLNACIREAYHIMQALGVDEVWFTDADADVAVPWKRVGAAFFLNLTEVHGRGGTSFIPAIESAQKLFPPPDLLIYCTDGDGSAPKRAPPNMAVVWAIILGGYARGRAPARWGHTVVVSEDPRVRAKDVLMPEEDEDDEPEEDEDDDSVSV
jgi:predicted metal-dependent peptidase